MEKLRLPTDHAMSKESKRAEQQQQQQQEQSEEDAESLIPADAIQQISNSVSCEDLLDFADKKPKGCERGIDSDEVRIMLKVLGQEVS